MKITRKDIQIVSCLRRDSREMLTRLSRKTGVPVSTIFDRLKLHTGGFIRKNTALIAYEMLGFNSRAKVAVKVDREDRDELREFLKANKNINSLYRINNGYDFMFEAIFHDMKELEDFLYSLEKTFRILDKNVYYVLDSIREEEFLSQDNAEEIAFNS